MLFINIYQDFPVLATEVQVYASPHTLPLETHMKLFLSHHDLSLNECDFVRKTKGKALTTQWLILDFISEFEIWLYLAKL